MRLNAKTGTHPSQTQHKKDRLTRPVTAISTSKVLLVPYCAWHVPRYHEWMKDEVGTYFPDLKPIQL